MESELIHKHDIAIEFIDVSIQLYNEEKYIPSLHLAGAAEEIFHDTLIDDGSEPVKKKSARLAQSLAKPLYGIDQPKKSSIERVMDHSKNAVKHVSHRGEYVYEVRLRPQIDAFRMIRRAICNARLANTSLGRRASEFMAKNELDIHPRVGK